MSSTIIVGGGLLGLSTAKALTDRGVEVELLEAREQVGLETSFANGGLLTPSLSDPWNAPGIHWHLWDSLFNPASAMKLHFKAIPSLFRWGVGFLRNSSQRQFNKALSANFQLASYSLQLTDQWRDELQLDYGFQRSGSLKIFRDNESMAQAVALAETLSGLGLEFESVGAAEAVRLEPALSDIRQSIAGALWFPGDCTGDSHQFCLELKGAIKRAGVTVRTGTSVTDLVIEKGRVHGVRTKEGVLPAENVVIASGVQTPRLLKGTGLNLPIAPAKGYSVTFQVGGLVGLPKLCVIDDGMHAGITPLGDRLRVVGTAEFVGNDTSISQVRVDNLVRMLREIYPTLSKQLVATIPEAWSGLRPMSNDGRPFIGESRVKGLYMNVGHGHLGWTEAVGSGCLLADLLTRHEPALAETPFAVHRND